MTDFNCGRYVVGRIKQLVRDDGTVTPISRAALAQLRQAASAQPGTAPAIWALTSEGVPEMPDAQRERVDWAIHTAMTQFAIHQQSRDRLMHDPSQPFGRAVRRLAHLTQSVDAEVHESPVYKRFTAMAMSTTPTSLLAHSRGIISQLRTHEIPFDYGRYASDLYWFTVPGQAAEVRRRWGRDFHQLVNEDNPTSEEESI